MKAYHVHDKENSGEEACHEIVFAESPAQAKYKSEAYNNGVPWTDISVIRKPQFDQYAETGIIPKSAYIADGWYFECDACGSFSATHENEGKVLCEDCYKEVKGDGTHDTVDGRGRKINIRPCGCAYSGYGSLCG